MTLKEFSDKLNGTRSYPFINNGLVNTAKQEGIVIVHGASDDLVEFCGAYEEEAGCVFNGGIVSFDSDGTSDDGNNHRNEIKCYWCGQLNGKHIKDSDFVWEYETDIPHETFLMYEQDDNYVYCQGIVFYLKDMK